MENVLNVNKVNNSVDISGRITSFITISHKSHGKTFYKFELLVKRLSGLCDKIPCIIPEDVLNESTSETIKTGYDVNIKGYYRSRNTMNNNKRHLELYVLVKSIDTITEDNIDYRFNNIIILDGHICSKPIYRKTPLNNKDITDVIIAVNDSYGRSYYAPCICWKDIAKYASKLEVGSKVTLQGRIQSREYTKVIGDESITKTAYEISVNHMNTYK